MALIYLKEVLKEKSGAVIVSHGCLEKLTILPQESSSLNVLYILYDNFIF